MKARFKASPGRFGRLGDLFEQFLAAPTQRDEVDALAVAVMVTRQSGKGVLKGADLHVLVMNDAGPEAPSVLVAGVAEVKSGSKSSSAMGGQIEKHLRRARQGLRVAGVELPSGRVQIGEGVEARVLRITVQPSNWPLPRTLRFETMQGKRRLMLDPPTPPLNEDQLMPLGSDRWHVSLRWSKEAIAAAAYEMTFWYMENRRTRVHRRRGGLLQLQNVSEKELQPARMPQSQPGG